jgi:putative FmdB family regulatory protein
MPIYEYECRDCGSQFEALVRNGSLPACPGCRGQQLDRLLSLFAVSSEGTRTQALKDGRARGARVKRDQDHAQREYEQHHQH